MELNRRGLYTTLASGKAGFSLRAGQFRGDSARVLYSAQRRLNGRAKEVLTQNMLDDELSRTERDSRGASCAGVRVVVRALNTFAAACLLACLLCASAQAYTLVMRGGQRVEIPERFFATGATLTYEAAPGINVTLQLAHIDIEATERENREPPGSFLRRAAATEETPATTQKPLRRSTRVAAPTITNRELEPAQRARLQSERDYESRRKELGLPSLEESRRRAEEDGRELREIGRRHAERAAEAESYWRERAAALREESAALDAEINYLRSILSSSADNFSTPFSTGSVAIIAGVSPSFGGRALPPLARAPITMSRGANSGALVTNGVGSIATAQLNGGSAFGVGSAFGDRQMRARGGFVRRDAGGFFARRTFGRGFFAPGIVALAAPFDYASADAASLDARLRLLEAEREGLAARWRLLEEEARRAGAMPGWLRE
jgi:hypothetical protein